MLDPFHLKAALWLPCPLPSSGSNLHPPCFLVSISIALGFIHSWLTFMNRFQFKVQISRFLEILEAPAAGAITEASAELTL